MTENYAITIKHVITNSDATEIDLYNQMLSYIARQKGTYVSHTYEHDSRDRLHLHGHFIARKGIRYNLYKQYGYHIHCDHLKNTEDVNNWTNYMFKDEISDNAVLNHYRKGLYEFIDQ